MCILHNCYIFAVSIKVSNKNMNWNEMKRKAIEHGFKFVKHGGKHDIYFHPGTKQVIQIERHWTQEVRPGLMKSLKKQIGF